MKKIIIIVSLCTIVTLLTLTMTATAAVPQVRLPPAYMTISMTPDHDGSVSWFNFTLTDIPDGLDITNGVYPGWCVQKYKEMAPGPNHQVKLKSCYASDLKNGFEQINWTAINYIINHRQGLSRKSVQWAIWNFTDDYDCSNNSAAQALVNNTKTNGHNFIPQTGELLAIVIEGKEEILQLAFLELTVPAPPPQPPAPQPQPPGDDEPPANVRPTADGTKGEPYRGFINQSITFDGSRSYDYDGRIITWRWNLGDGTNKTGEIVNHTYKTPGIYNVTLVVTDNKFATNVYTTIARITAGNNPPNVPVIAGPLSGRSMMTYDYTIVAIDPDDDVLKYIIDWGDSTQFISSDVPSGTSVPTSHAWAAPGFYLVQAYAQDPYDNISDIYQFRVAIDVTYVAGFGYLIDQDGDGVYDTFHNNETGVESQVGKQTNGNYLIDTTGDGQWNMEYNPTSGQTEDYQEQGIFPYAMILLVIVIIVLIAVFLLARSKRQTRTLNKNQNTTQQTKDEKP